MGWEGVLSSTGVNPAGMVTDRPNLEDLVNSRSICAPAALNELCPEMYSANGGVGM